MLLAVLALFPMTDRNGNYHSYQYDPQDRLYQWAGYLTASYDGAGHLSQITDGLNGTWNFNYDNIGRLTQTSTD